MKGDIETGTGSVIKEEESDGHPSHIWKTLIVRGFLCLIILCAGLAGASYIKKNAPKAKKRPPKKVAPLVRTQTVHPSLERVIVRAMGVVIPARQVLLKSRVSGAIISIHPEFSEGGLLKKGDVVLKIDPEDYELAVKQMQSQVVTEQYEFKLELGRQEVAEREWALLKDGKPRSAFDEELALRKPHLEKAKADMTAVKAQLSQARLDLSRTKVLAPFNSVIREKNVDIGSQVSVQEELAELVGTDEYWIRVPVSVDRLKWITIPRKTGDSGSPARVFYGNGIESGYERTGKVIKLLADLETEGRMARVLVAVQDPLGLKAPDSPQPPLLVGEYVRAEIQGHSLDRVYRIPRTALRENSRIWIAGEDGLLHIREVETLWRDANHVLLREGLEPGEKLIVSDLAAPVEGMKIRVSKPENDVPSQQRLRRVKGE
jgi:RND family efflux transporter MFP subunit